MPDEAEFDKDKFLEACRTAGSLQPEDREHMRQMLRTKSMQRAFSEVLNLMDSAGLSLLQADLVTEAGRAKALQAQGHAQGIMTAWEYMVDSAFNSKEDTHDGTR